MCKHTMIPLPNMLNAEYSKPKRNPAFVIYRAALNSATSNSKYRTLGLRPHFYAWTWIMHRLKRSILGYIYFI